MFQDIVNAGSWVEVSFLGAAWVERSSCAVQYFSPLEVHALDAKIAFEVFLRP